MPAPPGIPGATPGTPLRAALRRPDRTADYANAVRAGMADLVDGIHEPHHTTEVTPHQSE